MRKDKMLEKVKSHLIGGENLIGSFIGRIEPKFIWYFLFGPIVAVKMKHFVVAVSDKKIYFHKLGFWGGFDSTEEYEYNRFTGFSYKKGILTHTLYLKLKNDENIKLKAQAKGTKNVLIIDDYVLKYIEDKTKMYCV